MDDSKVMSYAIYSELALFLRTSGSALSISEAIVRAIKQWIKTTQEAESPQTGYQWKCVFLPSGTRLRMSYGEQLFYADIVDDSLIFRGRIM
ncbi:MAG TPA: hypothetical protein VGF27_13720 [Pseudoduganella sp.]